jgi:hypothetical protein
MVITVKALNLAGIDASLTESETAQFIAGFKDGDQFNSWSRPAAAFCIKQQLVVGSEGRAQPNQPVTRAQAAVMIMKMLKQTDLI